MLPDRRAVVFDLDDTLYPYRRFVRSGFAAVAAHLARTTRVDERRAFRTLVRASRGPDRGVELQVCLEAHGVSMALLPTLISVLKHHQPTLSLPRPVVDVLRLLRSSGWRLGVLTNGPRVIQARKVASLGVARYVDTIVYATEHGSGAGKPDTAPFVEVLRRLGVPSSAAVFVGDDEVCDVGGAARAGLLTVRCTAWRPAASPSSAHVVADRWGQVSGLVYRLLEEARSDHAA